MTADPLSKQAPAASVLMPVRDGEAWLAEAVASIRGQSFADWELLIVDDHSKDGSRTLAEGLAVDDARIRVVSSEGEGLVAALNTGLAAARGPLLARMDADDIAHPQRLERQCALLAARPDLFAVSCRASGFPGDALTDGMRRYLDWQNSLLTAEAILRERFVESPVLHPSLVLRTTPLRERLGGWRDAGWAEDWDLLLRATETGLAFERVDADLLHWRLHEAQFTRRDPRCSPPAMERARAHFLARHLRPIVEGGRPVVILGAGPTGKSLARALLEEGLRITAFADVAKGKIGNTVADGRGGRWPVLSGEDIRASTPAPFALAAVGSPGGRRRLRKLCLQWGWKEERDFLVVA
jgi:hypothetical protein